MALNLDPNDFSRIVAILSSRPAFVNPMTRMAFVIEMLQPSPRAANLLARLPLSLANANSDAVNLVHYLLTFGQDVPGREALTLVIRALLDVLGEGDDREFLFNLFEQYALENPDSATPITLLFMTANPTNTTRLRLDEEYREIDDALLKSRYRERFKLALRPALRAVDLQESLLHHQPGIAHFSGHGAEGGLIFEDETGKQTLIDPAAVADLFRVLTPKVQLVVLNACYSAAQAEQLIPQVGCVVGMSKAVGDKAAIQFATAFYRALSYGMTIQTAYDLGINQIMLMGLKGADIPLLSCSPSCDPTKVKLI